MNDTGFWRDERLPGFLRSNDSLARRIREFDWSKTSLGSIDIWPQSLSSALSICLNSNFPIAIYWGKELVLLYNEAWSPILGEKHPWALGQPARKVWPEIWNDIEPQFVKAFKGQPGGAKDALLPMQRHGYTEECYFDFTFTPIFGEHGNIEGVFNAVIETTYRVINERRTSFLQRLVSKSVAANSIISLFQLAIDEIKCNPLDIPFAIIYTINAEGRAVMVASTAHDALNIEKTWPVPKLGNGGLPVHVNDINNYLGSWQPGYWPEPTKEALIVALKAADGNFTGFIVLGISTRCALDKEYQNFFELVASSISNVINTIKALEGEHKRAEAFAEIDRAKTTFFSNISHELRTPLTLMLAPMEDLLNDANARTEDKLRIDIAFRNTRRLLKLVNTLLDFSRIEARRMTAKFERVNLSTFTQDLAGVFRAAIEKTGIRFNVFISEEIEGYVDVDMWEKIVLNLLSNAFKYTHTGEITISLKHKGSDIELSINDTGIGIPDRELGKIFERFHRVQSVGGRSQEGTGIGLALVNELVKLHGGTISVTSQENKGSVFTVAIPTEEVLFQAPQIPHEKSVKSRLLQNADVFLEEAVKWLPASENSSGNDEFSFPAVSPSMVTGKKRRIIIADDNADMRSYLRRLLGTLYEVITVGNGDDALDAVLDLKPDLVLSDVMMPGLNGFELVSHLKANTDSKYIPVLLLSAKAGEDATVEGLASGADDYLTKPFSAKELLSRIDSNLRIAESRLNSVKQVNNLFMNAPVPIAILAGRELRYDMANEKYLELAGKSSVVGKTFDEVFPELVGKGIKELLMNVLNTGEPFHGNEFQVDLERQGRTEHLCMNFVYTPVRGIDNDISGVMVIAIDVTDTVLARRKMEQVVAERTHQLTVSNRELKLGEERYHRMVEQVEDYAIIFLDENGIVQNWNRGAEKIKGYKEDEIVGRSFEKFYLPQDRERNAPKQLLQEAALKGKVTLEGWRVRKYGDRFWASISITALHDDNGKIIGFSKVTRDLTERKMAEDKLQEYSEDLETQNRELEQFAYAASHDMKEPLRKISFFGTSLLDRMDGMIDTKSREFLHRILTSTQKMNNLVDNLLNYSKTTANVDAVKEVDLNEIMQDVLMDAQEHLEQNEVAIFVDKLPTIIAVPFQCHQLFDNLINNAVKYRKPGRPFSIKVVYQIASGAEIGRLANATFHKISVIDNGIGFEQKYAEKIFEIFQRLGHEKSGSGVGLAICKRIALNHNGIIRAYGTPEEGARFDLYLPVLTDSCQ
jgi:PAS domain S-box-containing protein